jgi:hypothetical protein
MRLLAILALVASSLFLAGAGYPTLPSEGCPSRGQFGIEHFTEVQRPLPGALLYRGGRPTEAGIECLARMGVTTLIDLRTEKETASGDEARWARENGLRYLAFPMTTDASVPSQECRSRGWDPARCNQEMVARAIGELRSDTGPVYIHCARGEDRTGLVMGAYRFLLQQWSAEASRREMRSFGYSPYKPLEEAWTRITSASAR